MELAAVILRARTRDDKAAPLSQLTQIISDIVPRDMIKTYSGADWKKVQSIVLLFSLSNFLSIFAFVIVVITTNIIFSLINSLSSF